MFDDVFAFLKVVSSAVADQTRVVLLGSEGLGGTDAGQEMFSALGMVGRPKPPDKDAHVESFAARRGDGYAHLAYRDVRLHEKFPNPKEGEFAWVHYGGGFHSMTEASDGTTIHVIYAPYDFDGDGIAQKAHAFMIDPADGLVSMIHGEGHTVAMRPGEIMHRLDGSTFFQLKPGEIIGNAAKIMLKGNVYLGAAADTGVALLAGAASPPSPSVFVSPT